MRAENITLSNVIKIDLEILEIDLTKLLKQYKNRQYNTLMSCLKRVRFIQTCLEEIVKQEGKIMRKDAYDRGKNDGQRDIHENIYHPYDESRKDYEDGYLDGMRKASEAEAND